MKFNFIGNVQINILKTNRKNEMFDFKVKERSWFSFMQRDGVSKYGNLLHLLF